MLLAQLCDEPLERGAHGLIGHGREHTLHDAILAPCQRLRWTGGGHGCLQLMHLLAAPCSRCAIQACALAVPMHQLRKRGSWLWPHKASVPKLRCAQRAVRHIGARRDVARRGPSIGAFRRSGSWQRACPPLPSAAERRRRHSRSAAPSAPRTQPRQHRGAQGGAAVGAIGIEAPLRLR